MNNNNNNVNANLIMMELTHSVNQLVRGIFRWAVVAVLLNIAASLNPELTKQFPVIFGFANGTLRAANLIIKWLMELIYAARGLHFIKFFGHWIGEVQMNLKMFWNWVLTTGKW